MDEDGTLVSIPSMLGSNDRTALLHQAINNFSSCIERIARYRPAKLSESLQSILVEASTILEVLRQISTLVTPERQQTPLVLLTEREFSDIQRQVQHSLSYLEDLASELEDGWTGGPERYFSSRKGVGTGSDTLARVHEKLRDSRLGLMINVESIRNTSQKLHIESLTSIERSITSIESTSVRIDRQLDSLAKALDLKVFEAALQKIPTRSITPLDIRNSQKINNHSQLIEESLEQRYLKVVRKWRSSKQYHSWLGQLLFWVETYDDGSDRGRNSGQQFTAVYRLPVFWSQDTYLMFSWYNDKKIGPHIEITTGQTMFVPFHHDICRALEHGDLGPTMEACQWGQLRPPSAILKNGSLSLSISAYAIFCSQLGIAEALSNMNFSHNIDVFEQPSWIYLKRELMRENPNGELREDLISNYSRYSLPDIQESVCPSLDQLLKAILSRDYEHVEKSNNADLDTLGADGYSPLHLAAMLNDSRMVTTLLSMGADVQLTDVLGKTPLHFVCEAVEFNHFIASVLYERCADLNPQDIFGYTPLHCATARNSLRAVEFLLGYGADPDITNFTREETPLNMLSGKKDTDTLHLEMIQVLVDAGARLDLADGAGITPLMNAIKNPDVRLFKRLHQAGASLNETDFEGKSILHYAAIWGRSEVINYLASTSGLNVDPDLVDGLGRRASDLMDQGMSSDWQWCYLALERKPKDRAIFNDLLSSVRAALDNGGSEKNLGPNHPVAEDKLRAAESHGKPWDSEKEDNAIDVDSLPKEAKNEKAASPRLNHHSDADLASIPDDELCFEWSSALPIDEAQIETQQAILPSHKQLHAGDTHNDSVETTETPPPLALNPSTQETTDTADDDHSSENASEAGSINTRGETISSTAMSSAIFTLTSTRRQLALKEVARLLSKQAGVTRVIHTAAEDAEISFRMFTSVLKLSFRDFSTQFSLESSSFPAAARFFNMYAGTITTTTLEEMEVSFSPAKFQFQRKPDDQEWLNDYEACLEFQLNNRNLPQLLPSQDQLSELDDSEDDIPDFTDELLKNHLLNSRAIQILQETFQNLAYPSFYRAATQLVVWSFQTQDSKAGMRQADMPRLLSLVADLSHANLSRVDLRETNEISWLNSTKLAVECLTGRSWDWRPWHPPCEPLPRNHARLEWRCSCGELHSANLPVRLARKLQQLIRKHANGNSESASASESTFASTQQDSSQIQLRDLRPKGNETNPSPSGAGVTPAMNDGQTRANRQDQIGPKYIFLVVSSDRHRLSQLNATDNDMRKFAHDLRTEYYRLRGFWRRWFSISTFSHCDFVKFEKFCPHEYEHRGLGLPDRQPHANDYWFRPRPPDYSNPPIGPNEFRHIFDFYAYRPFIYSFEVQKKSLALLVQPALQWPRFFAQIPPLFRDLRDGKLPKDSMQWIPQRFRYFEEATFDRESLWGLHAREKPSVLMALLYMIIFLSPSLAFCFIYLFGLGGETVDLQNATAPFTISMTFISMFIGWLAVGGRDTPEKASVR